MLIRILSGLDTEGVFKRYLSRVMVKILKILGVISAISMAISGLYIYRLYPVSFSQEKIEKIADFQPLDNTMILDRNGKIIGELFSKYHIFFPFSKIPRKLVEAIVAIEDRNFFYHSGIDMIAILRAFFDLIEKQEIKQGASTITQQVIKNLLLTRKKSLHRKAQEIILSLILESKLSKSKIFEIYVNALFLGNGSYGVGAAAERYFGRSLDKLEVHELALIAGLFQSPSRYDPTKRPKLAKQRQLQVLKAMVDSGYMSLDDFWLVQERPLKFVEYHPRNEEVAPYFIDWIKKRSEKILGYSIENMGLRIHTTLDQEIQGIAKNAIYRSESVFSHLEEETHDSMKQARIEAAAVITHHYSGEILAMIGGRDYKVSQFNRAVHSRRSPGSAFKPIVYSLALQEGYRWSDLVYVSPVSMNNYRPKNNHQNYLSETTLLGAFYKSLNTPTVELGARLGIDNVINHAEKFGILSSLKSEMGTFLGGSEVTIFDMVRTFSTIANRGNRVDPIGITKITTRDGNVIFEIPPVKDRFHRVISEENAYLMLEGLRATLNYGTAFKAREMASWAVGKTGTSNNARDNWFCGFTDYITAVIWVGTDNNSMLGRRASGNKLALPIWMEIVQQSTIRKFYPDVFDKPSRIESVKIDPNFGHQRPDGIDMYFNPGTVPMKHYSDLEFVQDSMSYRRVID